MLRNCGAFTKGNSHFSCRKLTARDAIDNVDGIVRLSDLEFARSEDAAMFRYAENIA